MMNYNQPITKDATATVLIPTDYLNNIKKPKPTISTREYFKKHPPEEGSRIHIPLDVGLEAEDGTIYSIWELESFKSVGEFKTLKNWRDDPNPDSTHIEGLGYTYYNKDSFSGIIGTMGNRNTGVSLMYDLTPTYSMETTKPYIDPNTQTLMLPANKYIGTTMEMYSLHINMAALEEIKHDILFTEQKMWYLLPNKEPMSDTKLIASLKGIKSLDGLFMFADNDPRLNKDMQNALLSWLAGNCLKVRKITYESSYLYTKDTITHKGFGILTFQSPRQAPTRGSLPQKPIHYNAIERIWMDRAPLSLIMNIIMVKGFDIHCQYYKKSSIIGVVTSDWGKTLLLLKALINNNLARSVAFSKMVNTITSTSKVGSIKLVDLYTSPLIVFDEAKDIASVEPDKASLAIKNMASGDVSGDAKNDNETSILCPPNMFLAADELREDFVNLASNDEIDNRTLYPVFQSGTAAEHFAGYTEADVLDVLTILLHDMFYDRYDLLMTFDVDERIDWANSNIVVDEGDLDRRANREANTRYPFKLLGDIIANYIDINPEESFFTNPDFLDGYSPDQTIAVAKDGSILINSPIVQNKGLFGWMSNISQEMDSHLYHGVKRAYKREKFGCMAIQNRKTMYMGRRSTETHNKATSTNVFRIPIDQTVRSLKSIDAVYKLVKSEELQQAIKDRDITPFLDVVMQNKEPNPTMNAIVGRLINEWDRLATEKEENKGDNNVAF